MSVDDLKRLPADVSASAQVYANGEVSWPIDDAERAIHALADAGFVVLRLDVRQVDDDGGIREVAWSAFDPRGSDDLNATVAQAHQAALAALARPDTRDFGNRILITWDSPRSMDELAVLIAQVPSAESPYEVGLKIMSAAVEPMLTSEIAARQYRLWSALTDWMELEPAGEAEALAAMRKAAAEWQAVQDDPTARDRYFNRWLYDILGYERPA